MSKLKREDYESYLAQVKQSQKVSQMAVETDGLLIKVLEKKIDSMPKPKDDKGKT